MDKKPLVSVIVPAYNAEKVLPRSLSSLFNQDYKDIEIIVVNDGSKDGSLKYLRSLQAEHKNLVVVDQKNGGVSKARNAGIAAAKGGYIAFLDADDEFPKDYLSKLVNAIGNNDMAFSGVIKIQGGKERVDSNPEGEPITGKEFIRYLFDPSNYGFQTYVWNKLFRKSIVDENGLRFDERFAFNEDRVFCFEFCRHANKVVPVHDAFYRYFLTNDSAMGNIANSPKALTLIDSYHYFLEESGYPWSKEEKGLVAYNGFHDAYYFVYRHQHKSAARKLVKEEIRSFEMLAKNKKESSLSLVVRLKILAHKALFR